MRMRNPISRDLIAPMLLVGAFIVAWELFVLLVKPPAFILPAPSSIALAVYEEISALLRHSRATMTIVGIGFAAGSFGGLLLAVLMSVAPILRKGIYPLVIASQTTPKIAVAPLLVVWFGVGLLPKVLIVALLAFFPVLINTLAGLDSTDRGHLDLMKSVNATRWQTYRDVRVPGAIPYIYAGLKLALTVSVIGGIIAEWVAGTQGLGFLLLLYNATLRTTELFAVLVVLVVLATAAFALLEFLERRMSWEARIAANVKTSTTVSQESSL